MEPLPEPQTYRPVGVAEQVLRDFASGVPGSVRAIYDAYHRQVFTVAMSMLGIRALAEEALQQTFVNAWRRADSYDPGRPIAPWLYSIARRASIDVYRRERRHTHSELDPEQSDDTEALFGRTWEAWQVRTALGQLREEDRETLRMLYYEGLTQSQAAERLGIALGTVKSRTHRAQQRLAEMLRHLEQEQ